MTRSGEFTGWATFVGVLLIAAPAVALDDEPSIAAPLSADAAAAAPSAPKMLSIEPMAGASTTTTRSSILEFTGMADPGDRLTLYDRGVAIGSAVASKQGVWRHVLATPLLDGAHVFTAIATGAAGKRSAASAARRIRVAANVSVFSALTDQWSKPVLVDALKFFVESANLGGVAPWALTLLDPHTLRFQLRPGDIWADGGSHRSEIGGGSNFGPRRTLELSYQFTVEAGVTDQYWTVLGQFHSDDGSPITQAMNPDYPVFAVELTGNHGHGEGDYLAVWADYAKPGQNTPTALVGDGIANFLYVAPTPITRGRYVRVDITALFENSSDGFLDVWFDGKQVVDYHGPLGYGAPVYWKEGVYQDEANTKDTIAARYRNLSLSDLPSAPLILTSRLAGSQAVLTGRAPSHATLTVYDGAKVLGQTNATGPGYWTFRSDAALAMGAHAFKARATDFSDHPSAFSNVVSLTVP